MSSLNVRQLAVLAPFVVLLTLLFMRGGWYESAQLVIRGTAIATDAVIVADWDSGAGLNDYERRKFNFLPFRGSRERDVDITITRASEGGGSPSGRVVQLTELRIDDLGRAIPLSAQTEIRLLPGYGWRLDSERSAIHFAHPARQQISFLFSSSLTAGTVAISVNDWHSIHDLSRDNWEILSARLDYWLLDESGNFTLSFRLPSYRIDSLFISGSSGTTFSSVQLRTRSGLTELPFKHVKNDRISISQPNRNLKRYFHPFHFTMQVIAALLTTWLVFILARATRRRGGIRHLVTGRQYRSFWLFFCGTLAVYSIWLLAFWPGVMSVDSLNIWRAAVMPYVRIANHPYVNELWYLFLSFFWKDPAVVPIAHVVLVSILVAVALFTACRRGVPLLLLLPCWLLLLVSVPVGLYQVTLWKDVPFALLVVFWGLALVYVFDRKQRGRNAGLSIGGAFLLLLSFYGILTVRYNGLVYLFVIPLLAGLIYFNRISKRFLAVSLVAGLGVCYLILSPPAVIDKASYFRDFSRIYLNQMKEESFSARVVEAATSYPRILDIKKHSESSDFWHYYLGDRHAYSFLREVGWYDVYPYRSPERAPFPGLKQKAMNLYWASLEYPWLYLSWYPFVFLYLFLLSILLYRWLPRSAIFSTVILAQVAALLIFVGTVNWRYYYFMLLGGYFLLPVMLLDLQYLGRSNRGTSG